MRSDPDVRQIEAAPREACATPVPDDAAIHHLRVGNLDADKTRANVEISRGVAAYEIDLRHQGPPEDTNSVPLVLLTPEDV